MQQSTLIKAWEIIGDKTPLLHDCGLSCGAACCQPDEDGNGGVDLLPGEECLMNPVSWGKISRDPGMNAPMLICSGPCDRDRRPFLCRIFPLCPVIGKDGKWTVRMDARARGVCPLASGSLRSLDPDFVRSAALAVRTIAQEEDGEAFLRQWSDIEQSFRKPLF